MMIRRIATILAATSAFVMLVAGTAAASDTAVTTTTSDGWWAGAAEWTENGDSLRVCDLRPDGNGVRGYIYRPNDGDRGNGTVLIKASDPSNDSNCVTVSTNISETVTIGIKVCQYKGAWVGRCSWAIVPR